MEECSWRGFSCRGCSCCYRGLLLPRGEHFGDFLCLVDDATPGLGVLINTSLVLAFLAAGVSDAFVSGLMEEGFMKALPLAGEVVTDYIFGVEDCCS